MFSLFQTCFLVVMAMLLMLVFAFWWSGYSYDRGLKDGKELGFINGCEKGRLIGYNQAMDEVNKMFDERINGRVYTNASWTHSHK